MNIDEGGLMIKVKEEITENYLEDFEVKEEPLDEFNSEDVIEEEVDPLLLKDEDFDTDNKDVIIHRRLENGELIYAIENSNNETRFGRLEMKNGTLRIHSFDTEEPTQPCNTIPFRQLLSSLTGSSDLPGKVFFQFHGLGDELIVKTDEALAGSPRVLNFLYFASGLYGPSYNCNGIIRFDLHASIFCIWMKNGEKVHDAIHEGITDGGVYEAPLKKGFVYGNRGSSRILSSVNFCLKDRKRGRLDSKFAEIESGIQVLNKMKRRAGHLVQNCGFVIG